MTTIARILRCLLRVASPSRATVIAYGWVDEPVTWLDRWERRIDDAVADKMLADAEYGPYVCPGCYAVATSCPSWCDERERQERAELEDTGTDEWLSEEEYDDREEQSGSVG